jgi:serine/threonine protein kinase
MRKHAVAASLQRHRDHLATSKTSSGAKYFVSPREKAEKENIDRPDREGGFMSQQGGSQTYNAKRHSLNGAFPAWRSPSEIRQSGPVRCSSFSEIGKAPEVQKCTGSTEREERGREEHVRMPSGNPPAKQAMYPVRSARAAFHDSFTDEGAERHRCSLGAEQKVLATETKDCANLRGSVPAMQPGHGGDPSMDQALRAAHAKNPRRHGATARPQSAEPRGKQVAAQSPTQAYPRLSLGGAAKPVQPPCKQLTSPSFGGKYRLGKFLGRGATASVWEGMHETSGLAVAVKVFDQGSRDKRQAAREAKVLEKIKHLNIIEVFEVIETPTYASVVSELVRGESLRHFCQRQPSRRLDEDLARKLYYQVCDAVRHCHDQCIVHRDLKLENVLLDSSGENVKLIDFGFACQVGTNCTKLKAFCGTPSYMAPEIVRGEPYSGFSVDIWALGVVLFGLLVGALPFAGKNELQLYSRIRRGTFSVPEAIGERASRLIKAILRPDAAARPSATQLVQHTWVAGGANLGSSQGNQSKARIASSNSHTSLLSRSSMGATGVQVTSSPRKSAEHLAAVLGGS